MIWGSDRSFDVCVCVCVCGGGEGGGWRKTTRGKRSRYGEWRKEGGKEGEGEGGEKRRVKLIEFA